MSHRWLFRVNVANERETEDTKKARGLGHAMKCLSVATAAREVGGEVHFSIEGSEDIGEFFEAENVPYEITTDHTSVTERFNPDIIVTDINYLDLNAVRSYRKVGTVVNLAPRGECKYYADLSFNSARIEDVPRPNNAPIQHWFTGPEYAILNPEFATLRNEITTREWHSDKQGVIIQMGGVDQANMTSTVIEKLAFETFSDQRFTVVAGPFNPYFNELETLCEPYNNVSIVHDPVDFDKTVATHELGILATGISTYEALAVGVPSINLGLTPFHDLRGEYLEKEGLIRYLGRHGQLERSILNDTVRSLLYEDENLSQMRQRGMDAVDGQASVRIVDTVLKNI